MPKFLIDGEEIEIAPEQMKWGEAHEATQGLGVKFDPEDPLAAAGISLFVAIRRRYPELSPVQIVDRVRDFDFGTIGQISSEDIRPLGENNSGSPETIPERSGIQA